MRKENLKISVLNELLFYNPDTGIFTWKTSIGRASAGMEAGQICTDPRDGSKYRRITISGIKYSCKNFRVLFRRFG